MVNDTFDVLNARFRKEAITVSNWHEKKIILDKMLEALDHTETLYVNSKKEMKMFASATTIRGWSLTIKSTIALVEELLTKDSIMSLLGRLIKMP